MSKVDSDLKDWDTRFLDLAEHISKWSKDPSTKVGAVIVDSHRRIVSTGYNGFPVGVMDSYDRLTDRDTKYEMIIHAEANAILFAHQRMNGMTLYTTPFQPCSRCASLIIQSGISRVISYEIDDSNDLFENRWTNSFKLAKELFDEAGVELPLLEKVYHHV
jgi:dCMP deaminase